MRLYFLFYMIFSTTFLFSMCTEDECGPHPGMPNYLCPDGLTIAGPSDCVEMATGECAWEIIACPEMSFSGYLRSIEASFCMDECSQYHVESEIDGGFGYVNVISFDMNLNHYVDRFVEVELGEVISCVECSAQEILNIHISDDCQYPVECFINPCDSANCPFSPSSQCVPNYCGDCHADFYDVNGGLVTNCEDEWEGCGISSSCSDCTDSGCFWQPAGEGACADECYIADLDCYGETENWIAECPEGSGCVDLSGLFFGMCDMLLGVGYADGHCQYLSGCGWDVDGDDYSDAFFDTMDECHAACGNENMTCDEISQAYEEMHVGEYATCDYDNDCMAVWGDCDVGLGGCHYSVNEDAYLGEDIDGFVDMWLDGDCMQWVCDCSSMPYAQCMDGICVAAYCMSGNPAGCFQTGCDDGYECVVLPNDCVPSTCYCDGFYGDWYCTEDCGGGTCVESVLLGDLNGDGELNVVDIVLIVGVILNGGYDLIGDINEDGQLNVVDIVMIVNLVLGG